MGRLPRSGRVPARSRGGSRGRGRHVALLSSDLRALRRGDSLVRVPSVRRTSPERDLIHARPEVGLPGRLSGLAQETPAARAARKVASAPATHVGGSIERFGIIDQHEIEDSTSSGREGWTSHAIRGPLSLKVGLDLRSVPRKLRNRATRSERNPRSIVQRAKSSVCGSSRGRRSSSGAP